MENRKKYELKIIIDTENVDFLAETLTNYCQECFNKDNPCLICDNTDEHSYFKCPLGEIGCYDVKPEDWKKVLKPLDNDAKQSYISLIKTHTAKFADNCYKWSQPCVLYK